VAGLAELPSGEAPKALVWTDARVARWRSTGERPSPVMVWTPEQTKVFLARASRHEMAAVFWLLAFTGLRRGEAVGLRWEDIDLAAGFLTVSRQVVQIGWATAVTAPKSELEAFLTGYLTRHHHEETGLAYWQTDFAIGVDNDPSVY
jgi:integrase